MPAKVAELHHVADLRGQDYISVSQIVDVAFLYEMYELAESMREIAEQKPNEPSANRLRTASLLFYEPSTRTYTSFQTAANMLGTRNLNAHPGMSGTSVEKGETLEDTLLSTVDTTLSARGKDFSDVMVLRHKDNDSSERAAEILDIPVINAGSGSAEHPTQALLDVHTILRKKGRLDNLHVVMVGDMLHGRTVKSLAQLLALGEGNRITFVSPQSLAMPPEVLEMLEGRVDFQQVHTMEAVLEGVDVYYWTRVQKERFADPALYNQVKDDFILTPELAERLDPTAIFMHPLPRVNEIHSDVDRDPRSVYLGEQMRNGVLVRMALLNTIAGYPTGIEEKFRVLQLPELATVPAGVAELDDPRYVVMNERGQILRVQGYDIQTGQTADVGSQIRLKKGATVQPYLNGNGRG